MSKYIVTPTEATVQCAISKYIVPYSANIKRYIIQRELRKLNVNLISS